MKPFTGSYRADQTIFLLDPVEAPDTPIEEKERLVQSGRRHYSELITREQAPDPGYEHLFRALTERYKRRLAGELKALARRLAESCRGEITLVSLARAGTPIGALLKRALELEGRPARHYSISIVLGRGIDKAALEHLLGPEGRDPASLRFVDGWTAKGSIGRELRQAIAAWNGQPGRPRLDPALYVVMDLCGEARAAATLEDYAMPCGILNATVSGLVSRTMIPAGRPSGAFHACIFYAELATRDLTQWFYEQVAAELPACPPSPAVAEEARRERRRRAAEFAAETMRRYRLGQVDRIKPGIAEATRALLRRWPERVVVRDPAAPDVAHLLALARQRKIEVETDPAIPYGAWTLIRRSHE